MKIEAKIVLTNEESEEIFYNALCNGLHLMGGYGLKLEYMPLEYKAAKDVLIENGKDVCFEDILMQMLRQGNSIMFLDLECDGEYDSTISIKDVHEQVPLVPFEYLSDMINENDDADTADAILQTVFFKEIIFA